MHDTPRGTAEPVVPLESGAMPGTEASPGLDDRSRVPAEVAVKVMALIDEVEHLFGDPAKAWAALKAEIEYRKALRESRKSGDMAGPNNEPGPAEPVRREPRPFVGFDREIATYERRKPALLESAEGKWIVIDGEEVLGPFNDIADAERAGLKRFGEGPMFIKQVLAQEPPPLVLPPYLVIPCQT